KDGTCIRDFVHVKDIALAHLAMLNCLKKIPLRIIISTSAPVLVIRF
ncbi:MAG: NAD-dependent epimerase/dehydratase family protein, partial [Alphaproteobacteria bacterium]